MHKRSNTVAILLLLTGLWLTLPTLGASSCLSREGGAGIEACQQRLQSEPNNIELRIALADALLKSNKKDLAIEILRDGVELFPSNALLKRKLFLAESYNDEEAWIKSQRERQAEAAKKKVSAATKVNVIKCTKLSGKRALEACDAALSQLSGDSRLHAGKADALMDLNRVAEAVGEYEKAMALNPSDSSVGGKLKKARLERSVSVKKCQRLQGRKALSACDAALLRGASDEPVILERKGDIYAAIGNKNDALASYKKALVLAPANKDIKRKVTSLTAPPTIVAKAPPVPEKKKSPVEKADTPPTVVAKAPPVSEKKKSPVEKADTPPTVVAKAQPVPEKKKSPIETADAPPKQQEIRRQEVAKIKPQKDVISPPVAEGEVIAKQDIVSRQEQVIPPVTTFATVREKPAVEQPEKISFSNAPVLPGVTY